MDQAVTITPADESEKLANSVEDVPLDANTAEPTVRTLKFWSIRSSIRATKLVNTKNSRGNVVPIVGLS